jgi:hypothetical protein
VRRGGRRRSREVQRRGARPGGAVTELQTYPAEP